MSTPQTPGTGSQSTYGRGTMEEKGREVGRKLDSATARLDPELEDRPGFRNQVRDKLVAAKDRVSEGVQNGRGKVEEKIQEHPMRSMAIAFTAGALVGLLLRRRGRDD